MGLVFSAVSGTTTSDDQVIFALIGLMATLLAATVFLAKGYRNTKIAATQSTEANQAVNNVGPGQHRLWDKIDTIQKAVEKQAEIQEEFDSHGWGNLPDDLNDAVKLTTTIREVQRHHAETHDKLDEIISELRGHVEWEMNQKWKAIEEALPKYEGPLG